MINKLKQIFKKKQSVDTQFLIKDKEELLERVTTKICSFESNIHNTNYAGRIDKFKELEDTTILNNYMSIRKMLKEDIKELNK